MENGEIAHFEQSHFFAKCFPKAFIFSVLKWVYMEEAANLFPHNDTFWRVWERSLFKTLWEKEKLLVQAFSPFPTMFSTLSKTDISVCYICRLQMFSIWSGPKFCRVGMVHSSSAELHTFFLIKLSVVWSKRQKTFKIHNWRQIFQNELFHL